MNWQTDNALHLAAAFEAESESEVLTGTTLVWHYSPDYNLIAIFQTIVTIDLYTIVYKIVCIT